MRGIQTDRIKDSIYAMGHGAVFTANDFLEIANYDAIRQALSRLADSGKIQRIIRGVYYNPAFSELLQEYEAPSPHQIALAIARKFNWNIAPSGITALNMLGLSAQVSAKWSYISDGPYNKYEFNGITVEFKRRNNREIAGMSYKTALTIQAIKALGKGKVDSVTVAKIRTKLTDKEISALLQEARSSTVWIYQIVKRICEVD
ncbi:MAG: type IV toxin-antitoxin system AbiEi family antitoxin domain-containing protein [Peptococcaceae bacterium]|jgi:hypothetical protein|nr:type IV toxin-antitoxin system AbiEi family antitoxin domain-containing protein [Peptococcaceae bacterium]